MDDYKTLRQLLDAIPRKLENFDDVVEVFRANCRWLASTPTKFPNGHYVYRSRKHRSSSDRFWHRQCMSYHPHREKVRIGRANPTKSPVFYGSINTEEFVTSGGVSNLEIATFPPPPVQTFTVSVWQVVRPFELLPIITSPLQREKIGVFKDMYEGLQQQFAVIPDAERPRALELLEIMGDEFTQKCACDEDYLLSAAFAHYAYHIPAEGILYPSVASNFKGVNVAILPRVVDQKMRLLRAHVCQLQEVLCPLHGPEVTTVHFESMNYEEGEPFQWKPTPASKRVHRCTGRPMYWMTH